MMTCDNCLWILDRIDEFGAGAACNSYKRAVAKLSHMCQEGNDSTMRRYLYVPFGTSTRLCMPCEDECLCGRPRQDWC